MMAKVMAATLAAMAAVSVTADIDQALVEKTLSLGEKIKVWPDGSIPNFKEGAPFVVKDTNGTILRLGDVTVPELAYFPASGDGIKPAVLVCPGGGYQILAYNHEGTEVAEWLNSLGFSAFVIKYRCPGKPNEALMDAQRAISLIRSRAAEFEIDPARIGIMGFSAGANLSARVSTNHKKRAYKAIDDIDKVSCRPDFTLPIYPWTIVQGDNSEKRLPVMLRDNFPVDSTTPPAFLVQAEDDSCHVENALGYFLALKYAGVKAELHAFPDGGHGYGLRRRGKSVDGWEALAAKWLIRHFGSAK